MSKTKITLEQLDRLNAIYEESEVGDEYRLVIFPNTYGIDTIVTLQYYNEDNIQ